MPTLTIAPLATPNSISRAAENAIRGAGRLFLQTAKHPSAAWILDAGLDYAAMDDLYDGCFDFDELNAAIAKRLMCGENAVYAMPGRGPGAAQLSAIYEAAAKQNANVVRLCSSGYAEAAQAALPLALGSCVVVCTANELPRRLDPCTPLCIEELDTRMRAGEVKLALSEYYPDEYEIWFLTMNERGAYAAKRIPLFELDRQEGYFAATCCIIEAADPYKLTRGDADDLMRVLRRLRAPGGCPWDAEQTHTSLKSSLIEESYEVLDAVDREDTEALQEELGDLLLQVAMHTIIEEETSSFTLRDVTTGIISKLIYRHPHVFGDVSVSGSAEVLANWEQLKKKEKHLETYTAAMQAVPRGFPALMRAAKIQKKAANAGFDWASASDALYKLPEETDELKEAMAQNDPAHVDEELGDVLFAAVNVARLLKRDPEMLLNASTDKFMARFEQMERMILADGGSLEGMQLAQMDEYWDKVKLESRNN